VASVLRRLIFSVAVFALLSPVSAFADARSKARRAFEEGMRLIDLKKYEPGIEMLIRANEALPHPDVQYNIARACVDAGMLPEAIQWFETYLEGARNPADGDGVREVIRALRARIEPERAPSEPILSQPEGDDPAEPPPKQKSVPLPEETARDLTRLEQLAEDMKPLAGDRAKELAAIALRMREVAQYNYEKKPVPKIKEEIVTRDPVLNDPPKIEAPAVAVSLGEEKLREVEEYEEREVVTAATRRAARAQDAPAVVWVITQREIRQRGYDSVAEALKGVAGLHIIDDHVFIDIGIRGVHSGLRGMSRIIKVLVDDHPIAFRPTSGSLLGLEMIPIRAVDRIELIRGPASALYGANAFLGVLQIVTRQGGDIRGGSLGLRGGLSMSTQNAAGEMAPQGSASADAVIGTREGDLSILMAAQISRMNRSGLSLPDTSPFKLELEEGRRGPSVGDTSTPASLFGALTYDLHKKGVLSLQAGLQRLSARAEWLDYGALTHFTNVSVENLWVRLGYDVPFGEEAGFRAFSSYAHAGPTEEHRIRPLEAFSLVPNENRHIAESFGSDAVFSGVELRWDLKKFAVSTRIGADLDVDIQRLNTGITVFDRAEGANNRPGDTIQTAVATEQQKTFTDIGVYLQISASPVALLDLIGGLRYDYQDIYGSSLNGRLGSVLRLSEAFYLKALYGSSFRAPAADQLYHGSEYIGDTTGCLDYAPCAAVGLKPQTAHTGELVLGVSLGESFNAQVTGYVSFVDDLILSFPNNLNSFVTTNAGTYLSKGLELEVSAEAFEVSGGFNIGAHAYLALQNTSADIPQSLFQPAESIRAEYREASLFPSVSAGGGIDLSYLPAKLGLYLEGRFVGPRRASGSNLALSLGASEYDGEDIPGYFELDVNLSTRDLYIFAAGETVISLRMTDALGIQHAEGGYRGWDIPTIGRMAFLRVIQEY
jgi:iron complex outermembrane receptor protein